MCKAYNSTHTFHLPWIMGRKMDMEPTQQSILELTRSPNAKQMVTAVCLWVFHVLNFVCARGVAILS